MSKPTIPEHEHVVVDTETYFGLLSLHWEVQRMFREGELTDPTLRYLSTDAEDRLAQSRRWNADSPNHAADLGR